MRIRFLLPAALLVLSSPATALQHFMSVREVYAGPADQPGAQYVLLQMYQYFQNQVAGHSVDVYDATGALIESYEFPQHVLFATNQSYIWIATAEAEDRFGISADLIMTPTLPLAGGKVCFETFDCVSWGNYSGDSANPSPTGTPFNASGDLNQGLQGLAPGRAVHRDISAGDPNTLEPADDTNNSTADFDFAEPRPVNNLGQAGTDPGGGGYGASGRSGGGYGSGSFPAVSLLLLALLGLLRPLIFSTLRDGR